MATKLRWGAGTIFLRGKNYYFENKDRGIRASLRTGNKQDAVAEARRRFGHLEQSDEKAEQRQLLETYRESSNLISLSDAFAEYVRRLAIHSKKGRRHVEAAGKVPLAPKTVKMSESIWKKFCGWLSTEQSDIQTVDQITATIAEAYFIELRDEYKASSYNRHLAGLRGILDALLIAAGIDANPFRQVKQITKSDVAAETDSKRLLEPHELKIIDNKATGWIRPAVFVGFFTGLRLSDVVCLRWDAIELDTGFFRLTIRKTSKPDTIYAPEAMPFLIEWRKQCAADAEYVFPELASAYLGIGRKRDSSTATKQFQAFLTEDCKFDTKNDAGQTVLGFHSLRVCNATYASRSGATHEDIQARLQHSSGTTTDKYIRESDEEIREKLMQAHIPLAITGEAKPRNGKTHVRIRELVESMNGQNWMKAKAEILEVMK